MIISCEKNALIETNGEAIISDGSNIFFKDKSFFRVSYTDSPFCQTVVLQNEKIIKAENSAVVDLKKDKMLCFFKRVFYPEFTPLAEKSLNGVYINVHGDGSLKVSIEKNFERKIFTYNFKESSAKIEFFNLKSTPLALVYFNTAKIIKIYSIYKDVKELLSVKADGYEFNHSLYVTTVFNDIVGHVKQSEYNLDNGDFNIKSVNLKRTRSDPFFIKKELLPVAFFEELLVGGDPSPYLNNTMLNNIEAISGYLGDFKAVCPSPFGGIDEIGLMYEGGETGYDFTLRLIKCELKNGRLDNMSFVT